MSVYKPKGSRHYHFDFVFKGQRYYGSTNCAAKRDADAYERDQRTQAAIGSKAKPQLTVDEACGLYWAHRGKHETNATTTKYQLANLVEGLGGSKLLSDLGFAGVDLYVAKRRGQTARNSKMLMSPASINREIELLRRVVRLAANTYAAPDIQWGKLTLKEPEGRVRELSTDEEAKLFAALDPDLAALVEFAMLSGQRKASVVNLLWSKVDLAGGRAQVLGKGNKWHTFPLTPRMVALIANRPKVCAQVFTYECLRPSPPRGDRPHRIKGERYPFSKGGWARRWQTALTAAGIDDFRFHDLRHTTGTRVLRASGNLKVVQKLLNHRDITTTARYAHALEDDVRTALLAAESRNSPEAGNVEALKLPKKREN